MSSRHWWDLTTEDFANLDPLRTVALLPVCAVEQHGPHLPVRVDAAINAGILARALQLVPEDLPLLVLPPQNVGNRTNTRPSPAHSVSTMRRWGDFGSIWARVCTAVAAARSSSSIPMEVSHS